MFGSKSQTPKTTGTYGSATFCIAKKLVWIFRIPQKAAVRRISNWLFARLSLLLNHFEILTVNAIEKYTFLPVLLLEILRLNPNFEHPRRQQLSEI